MRRRTLHRSSWRVLELHLERLATRAEPARPNRVIDAREALERMDAGQYGVCIDCQRDIPMARLRACPEARRCITCQQRQDAYLAA